MASSPVDHGYGSTTGLNVRNNLAEIGILPSRNTSTPAENPEETSPGGGAKAGRPARLSPLTGKGGSLPPIADPPQMRSLPSLPGSPSDSTPSASPSPTRAKSRGIKGSDSDSPSPTRARRGSRSSPSPSPTRPARRGTRTDDKSPKKQDKKPREVAEAPPQRNLAEATCDGQRLYWATEMNNLVEVKRLLEGVGGPPCDPNQWLSSTGSLAVHAATKYDHVDVLVALLDAKADPLVPKPDLNTSLHVGCKKGNTKCVNTLCKAIFASGSLSAISAQGTPSIGTP